MKKINYRVEIEKLRHQYLRGKITLDEAKDLVNPMLTEMNIKGAEVTKQYGRKFYKLTFGYVFR